MKKSHLVVLTALVVLLIAAGAEAAGPRFVDQGDGTVTDTQTGLIWLKQADCFELKNWQAAMDAAAGLRDLPAGQSGDCGLSDGSKAGDWRLPTKAEWKAMIKDGCEPSISNDQGAGCYSDQSSFSGVQSSFHWSSTTDPDDTDFAWVAFLVTGVGYDYRVSSTKLVWPVRGGQ